MSLALIALLCGQSAQAGIITSKAAGGPWSVGTTWTGGVAPAATDDVVIATTAGSQVTLNFSSTAASVTVNSGATLGIHNDNITSRQLTIAGNLANNGTIALGTGAGTTPTGRIIFSGAGRTWTGSGDISGVKCGVQVLGNGSLDISGLTTPLKFISGSGGQPCSVDAGATLITGSQVIDNNTNTAMTFTFAAATSSLVTANPNGLIAATGTFGSTFLSSQIVYTVSTASFTFNGTATQVTTGLPATVSSLTFNNASGVNLSAPTTVTGSLKLSAKPLVLSVAAAITNLTVGTLDTGGAGTAIKILSLPSGVIAGNRFTLISYTTLTGALTDLSLGTLPEAYTGHLDTTVAGSIALVIDTAPILPRPLTWAGTPNGYWDTTTQNWLNSAAATAYNGGDFVTFGDTAAGTTTVNLTTTLAPASLTVDNSSKSYTFTGTGGISGSTGLTKTGSNSLTLANSGSDTFSGTIALNAGALIYDRSGSTTEGHAISGAGALEKSGLGTLTLSAANSHSGGSTVNGGNLRLGTATSAGSGNVAVNTGAALVIGASTANPIALSGGSLGSSATMATLSGPLTVSGNSTIYTTDPQSTAVLANLTFSGALSGLGKLSLLAGTGSVTPNDTTGACRFTATTDGGYSGTITLGNLVKSELVTTVSGPFSPAGTAKIVLTCGTSDGTSIVPSFDGTYCNLLLRNDNGVGDTTLGNNVELTGTGLACINPLNTTAILTPAGSLTTMGNLKIGNGQNLGIYRTAGTVFTVVFPTVTLAGGTATFSPSPPAFGATIVGSDLSLGSISESAAGAGVVMDGQRTLSITGTASYTGNTTVNRGTLNLTSTGQLTFKTGATSGSGHNAISGAGTVTLDGSFVIDTAATDATALTSGIWQIEDVTSLAGAYGSTFTVVGWTDAGSDKWTKTVGSKTYTFDEITGSVTLVGSAIDPYTAWINSYSPNALLPDAASKLPAADPDNDGLKNTLEFVLGGNPTTHDSPSVSPLMSKGTTAVTLTFTRADASELAPAVAVKVQVSADLATWNSADDITIGAADGAGSNGVTYAVAENGSAADAIVVTIPKNSATRKFSRVKAIAP